MRTLFGVGLAVLLAAGASAQHRGLVRFDFAPPPVPTYGSVSGFGNVVFPGTGHAPVSSPFSITDTTFASRLGATVGGFSTFDGFRRFRRPVTAFPVAYPVYVGGYYGGYPYSQEPNVTIIAPPPSPPVIINQNFVPERAYPVVRDYSQEAPSGEGVHVYEAPGRAPVESAADQNTYYLIAFKDHSIYSAFAYWVEGDTLHYVTSQRVHNSASLSLVDRELTDKLNRDRNLPVKLP